MFRNDYRTHPAYNEGRESAVNLYLSQQQWSTFKLNLKKPLYSLFFILCFLLFVSLNDTSSNIIIMIFIIFIVLPFVTITLKNIVIISKTTALIIYPLKYINELKIKWFSPWNNFFF